MKKIQQLKNSKAMLGLISGSLLVGIPALTTLSSVAIPVTQHNSSSILLSQVPSDGPDSPRESSPPPTDSITPPLPEEQKPPVAKVEPVGGKVNVKLVNQTNANITYQVISDTKPRTLAGRSDVTLQDLKTPINITFQRPDRGLLRVTPQSSEAGMLEVNLAETTDLGTDNIAMTIQENGNVLLN